MKELDNKLTEEDLDEVIEEIDEDGSGTVDFDGTILGIFCFLFFFLFAQTK